MMIIIKYYFVQKTRIYAEIVKGILFQAILVLLSETVFVKIIPFWYYFEKQSFGK